MHSQTPTHTHKVISRGSLSIRSPCWLKYVLLFLLPTPLGGGGAISMPRGDGWWGVEEAPTDNDDNMEKPPKVPQGWSLSLFELFNGDIGAFYIFWRVLFFAGFFFQRPALKWKVFPPVYLPFLSGRLFVWIDNAGNGADGRFDLHINPNNDWQKL